LAGEPRRDRWRRKEPTCRDDPTLDPSGSWSILDVERREKRTRLEPRPPAIEVFLSGESVRRIPVPVGDPVRTVVAPKTLGLFSLDRSRIVRRLVDDRTGWCTIVLDEKKRPETVAGAAGGGKQAGTFVGTSAGGR
jgi:hypothetical protein